MGPLRILILEDDDDIIDLLRSVLEPTYECLVAPNGQEGLRQLQAGEPDLIICDIMMPVMDGREFVTRMRALPGFEQVPVIFLTALGAREQIRDGYAMGAALYITKPIDPARFRRNLEIFISDHDLVANPKKRPIAQVQGTSGAAAREPFASRPASAASPGVAAGTAPGFVPGSAGSPGLAGARSASTMTKPRPQETPPPDEFVIAEVTNHRLKKKPRILVVEDDEDACQMIRLGLMDEFEILQVNDGITAIEHALRYKPDIFIIDGMLPRMTGYQLTMMLRKNRTFFRTPIIFISGKATQRDQQYVQRLGITRFMPKPFVMAQLRQVIVGIVNHPEFQVQKDRIELKQIALEHLQHFEVHRTGMAPVENLDRGDLERVLKQQLK